MGGMRADRKEIAGTVLNDPESYKVCAVCGAIVDKTQPSCPDCYAYRFDPDPAHVANAALDLATRNSHAVSHLDLTLEDCD